MEASPTIIYQDVTGESQSATSTIKALLELQQTSGACVYPSATLSSSCSINVCVCMYVCVTVKEKGEAKPRQHTIDLSQMAVPIPVPPDRRPSPEPSTQSTAESDTLTEYMGKLTNKLFTSSSSSHLCSD